MLFAPYERYQYARAPLLEVICQLRFPTILSIGAKEPAEFQEAIRKDFPQYAARQEQLPPKVVKKGNATAMAGVTRKSSGTLKGANQSAPPTTAARTMPMPPYLSSRDVKGPNAFRS